MLRWASTFRGVPIKTQSGIIWNYRFVACDDSRISRCNTLTVQFRLRKRYCTKTKFIKLRSYMEIRKHLLEI
jgi:hypothetical protein